MAFSAHLYDPEVIKTLKSYAGLIRFRSLIKVKRPHQKVVVTNGCFDILHAGHVDMLTRAREMGDYLIVGINSDDAIKKLKGINRPINSAQHRKTVLQALRCVDFVQVFDDTNAVRFLTAAEPNIYVKASDYSLSNMNSQELAVLIEYGTRISFTEKISNLSTTAIACSLS